MAALTYKERKNLPSSAFVFPKTRSYPVPDKARGRAALQAAGGARSGKPASPAKAAKIREVVHRKFPTIGKLKEPGSKAKK